jgi:hypothetical protein
MINIPQVNSGQLYMHMVPAVVVVVDDDEYEKLMKGGHSI